MGRWGTLEVVKMRITLTIKIDQTHEVVEGDVRADNGPQAVRKWAKQTKGVALGRQLAENKWAWTYVHHGKVGGTGTVECPVFHSLSELLGHCFMPPRNF